MINYYSLENKIKILIALVFLLSLTILWASISFSSQQQLKQMVKLEKIPDASQLALATQLETAIEQFKQTANTVPIQNIIDLYNDKTDVIIINDQSNAILLQKRSSGEKYQLELRQNKRSDSLLLLKSGNSNRKLLIKANLKFKDHQSQSFSVYFINWTALMREMSLKQSSQRFNTQLIFFFAFAACFGIIATVYTIRRFISPINQLTTKIEQLTESVSSKTEVMPKNSALANKDEIERLNLVFAQLANALQRSEQNQKQMIDSAAHELRTPVTIIQGQLEAAIHQLIPTDEEFLNVINQEVMSLSKLIEDLQLLSLAGAGDLSISLSNYSIESIIERVISHYSTQLSQKGITTKLQLQTNALVFIDEDRLGQVIKILLNNSCLHASKAKNITFEGKLLQLNDKAYYQLDIWDDGQPIDQEVKDKLFQPYFKSYPSADFKGTGLGLTIAQYLCNAQNCSLSIVEETQYLKLRLLLPTITEQFQESFKLQ